MYKLVVTGTLINKKKIVLGLLTLIFGKVLMFCGLILENFKCVLGIKLIQGS
jgi:hypothetical protein